MAKGLIPVFALITSAACFAGDTYVESAPAPMPAPTPAPSFWNWFVGGSYNYVDGWEDEMWTLHVGTEKFVGLTSHGVYLEIGWAGDNWSGSDTDTNVLFEDNFYDVDWKEEEDFDMLPVSLNYKFERPLFSSSSLRYYLGIGGGIVFLDAEWKLTEEWNATGGGTDFNQTFKESASDELWFGQLFAGLAWNITDNFELYGGGRWMFFEGGGGDNPAGELGLRYNF